MKKGVLFLVAGLIALSFTFSSCEKEVVLAKVTTAEVTDLTQSAAKCGGEVTDDGYGVVTYGVCWSTIENPTVDDNKTEDGTGTGVFTSDITGLAPNVTYYVRAYATNAAGTAYGMQKEFTTPL